MEFEGRIAKVMPTRTGTGRNGEWKTLPFVFEYFETPDQRWSDRVLLETMDHDVMRQIGQFVVRGEGNKAVEVDGACLLTQEIKCRCGFSHSIREWEGKIFNQVRLYKFELLTAQETKEPEMQQQPVQEPLPQPKEKEDDLPF